MKRSKLAVLIASVLFVGLSATAPSARADDNKAELVQIIRQNESTLNSLIADKVMSFNLSSEWWHYFLDRNTYAYQKVNLIAICLERYSHHTGGDDMGDLDQAGDASSPFVLEEINKLAARAHCTIECLEPVKAENREMAMDNLKKMAWPISEKTVCNPRGHKLNLTLVVDPSVKVLGCTMSKDGNTYRFTIPTTTRIEVGTAENFFRKGL